MSHNEKIISLAKGSKSDIAKSFFEYQKQLTTRSPLRYPGGKSRAVSMILPHIPEGTEKVCSPFFGGARLN